MHSEEIRVIKSDERGVIYDCGKSNFISRKKGSIGADHSHADPESIYLVRGDIEMTIGNETSTFSAPIRFEVPPDVYHKMVALTDIDFIIDRGNN